MSECLSDAHKRVNKFLCACACACVFALLLVCDSVREEGWVLIFIGHRLIQFGGGCTRTHADKHTHQIANECINTLLLPW